MIMRVTDAEVEAYTRKLGWALERLTPEYREAIVSEVRGHLYERRERGPDALKKALQDFGSPEQYARSFEDEFRLAEVQRASGAWPLIRTAGEYATRNVSGFLVAFFFGLLYLLSLSLFLVALLKPILPQQTGLFVGEKVFAFGILDTASAATTPELLGYWAIPLGLIGSLAVYAAATWMLRRFLKVILKNTTRQR